MRYYKYSSLVATNVERKYSKIFGSLWEAVNGCTVNLQPHKTHTSSGPPSLFQRLSSPCEDPEAVTHGNQSEMSGQRGVFTEKPCIFCLKTTLVNRTVPKALSVYQICPFSIMDQASNSQSRSHKFHIQIS